MKKIDSNSNSASTVAEPYASKVDMLRSVLKNRRFKEYIGSVLVLLIVGIVIVLLQWRLPGDGFTIDHPSPQTYRALRPMADEDPVVTKKLRDITGSSIVNVSVHISVSQEKVNLRRSLAELYQYQWFDEDGNTGAISVAPDASANSKLQEVLAQMDDEHRAKILDWAVQVGDACIEEFDALEKERNLKSVPYDNPDSEAIAEERGPLTESERTAILWKFIGQLVPSSDANIVYQILRGHAEIRSRKTDPVLTEKIRQMVMDDVVNISQFYGVGDVIVEKGRIITPEIARRLRYQGFVEEGFPVLQILIVFMLSLTLPLCLDIPGSAPMKRRPSWLCILFVILTTWCCEFLASIFTLSGAGLPSGIIAAFLCITGTSAFSVALAATTSSVLLLMLELPASDILLLLSLSVVTSMVGACFLQRMSSRSQVRQKVISLIVLCYLVRTAMLWIQGFPPSLTLGAPFGEGDWGYSWADFWTFALMSGAMCTAAAFLLTLIENYIGVISLFTLHDLSSTLTPLLQLMQKNAPGTYQHCLTMATLVEPVAMSVGMDANLMRVGAYYHDIGKLRRPRFFVENQGGGFNPHDEMTPTLSAITITSHVRDGLELAKEFRLPKRVRDFILEHHGTTCVRYFYNKAVASCESVTWEDFCYPGPKPQSRETALLMIVDSLEAAVRSLGLDNELMHQKKRAADGSIPHPNDGRGKIVESLKARIRQVIDSKIKEGQFDDVDFTLQDLDRIAEALKDAVLSMYHTREVKKIERRPGVRR